MQQTHHFPFSLENQSTTRKVILAAMFAALTYIATSVIHFTMPSPVGQAFVHLGNTVVALSVLFLGFTYGGTAGAIGFLIYDLLNGYVQAAPFIFVETYLVAFAITLAFKAFRYQDTPLYKITIVMFFGVLMKLFCTFAQKVILFLLAGGSFKPGVVAALSGMPASIINGITTLICVTLLYRPVKKILRMTFAR